GREGPVVHLGATVASVIAQALGLRRSAAMTLLVCGVAAAIAASFNAPIAGVFFALEVVVGHYGLTAFAPVVLASIVGTIVTRVHFGDYPAFILDSHVIVSFWEIPAFALLGIVSALVAWAFMASIFAVDDTMRHFRIPPVVSPALGGLAVGAIAIALPEVLGVGYEATDLALQGKLAFSMLIALAVAKTLATALTLGSGFSGGVFSPSLFVGAMVGSAFGVIAAAAVPEGASTVSTYAIVGMASVAGAVLGAPISTILIVFELTANFDLTIAVMIGAALAALIANQVIGRSYFRWSLERRGISLGADRARQMLRQGRVRDIMATAYVTLAADADRDVMRRELRQNPRGNILVLDEAHQLAGVLTLEDMKVLLFGEDDDRDQAATAGDLMHVSYATLTPEDDLATALERMEDCDDDFLPVVRSAEDRRIAGVIKQRDLTLAHNRALAEAGMEARGST
ncbi:MAG: chloride channel protein, partial [Proteobacteria bacterium]|nr:chloride channel protein [Pseudomonadota bacterium]